MPIDGSAGGQYSADRHPGPAGGAGATPLYGGVAKPNAGSRGRDQTNRGHHLGKRGVVAGSDQWSICVTRRSVQGRAPQLGSPPGQLLAAWGWTHSAVPIDTDRRLHDRGRKRRSNDRRVRKRARVGAGRMIPTHLDSLAGLFAPERRQHPLVKPVRPHLEPYRVE
jgi:hypothetical protein